MQCKTVREFDSSYTAKQFGYKDVNHYYADASIHNKLHKIKVPMLCLSARDDPFQPYEGKNSLGFGF
jgi:abhydrolase domain-containing protein 1/3